MTGSDEVPPALGEAAPIVPGVTPAPAPAALAAPAEPTARTAPASALEPTAPTAPTGSAAPAGPKGLTAPAVSAAPSGTADPAWSGGRLLRGGLAVLGAVLALVGSWALLRHGVQQDSWPSFLAGAGSTSITRYSGPWISAAAAAALIAGLLLLMAAVDLVRYGRSARLSV